MKKSTTRKAPRKSNRASTKTTPKRGRTVQFLQKSSCATCRKARGFMARRGYRLQFRDLWKEPLSAAELEKLIGDREHTDFLNPRSEAYRENDMRENPPSRREAIRMMVRNPNLIRRPVVVAGGRVVLGFDRQGLVHF